MFGTPRARRAVVATLGLPLLALSGCATADTVSADATSSSGPVETLDGQTLHLGNPTALTGYLAAYNEPLRNGIQLAVDQINDAGGIDGKVPIEVSTSDIQSDPAVAGTAAQELIDGGADMLVSVCDTDSQVSIAATADAAGVLNFSPCDADPTIPDSYDVYWPVGPAANAQTAQLADELVDRGYSNAYVLNDPGILYIDLITSYVEKALDSRGLELVGQDTFAAAATDFAPQIAAIQAASPQPDVIVTAMLTPDVATFVRQLRASGLDIPVVGTDGGDSALTLSVGGSDIDGTSFTTFGYPEEGTATADFYADYTAAYGSPPDGSFAALGYATIQVIAAAVTEAQTLDAASVAAVLEDGLTVPTAVGDIVYTGDGQHIPRAPVVVITAEDGAWVLGRSGVPDDVPAP